jgi:hypothetical protein
MSRRRAIRNKLITWGLIYEVVLVFGLILVVRATL